MDSSSDGSFAWTDASDDSTDNDTRTRTTMNTAQSSEESESGKTYKKKLQQRLFSGGDNNGTYNAEAHQQRKRKLSQHHLEAENIVSPKKKRIKIEPESDVDVQKVKEKHKSFETNVQDSPNDPYDESFLNLKVKIEQNFALPSPVKIKKSKSKSVMNDISISNGDMAELHRSPNESDEIPNSQICYEDDSSHVEDENNCDINKSKKKKKKSKRKREHSESEDSVQDSTIKNSYSAKDTVVKKHIESQNNESTDELANSSSSIGSTDRKDKLKSKKKTSEDHVEKVSNGNVTQIERMQMNSCSVSDKNTKRKTTVTERITFESDEDLEMQTKSTDTSMKTTNTKKSKLKNFIESNINVKPFCTKLPSTLVLTDDDDVWVIRCPKEVKAEDFQDKKWTLESKCKIKLNGQAYEGDLDDKKSNLTILSAENGETIIKNITINGYMRLRRRIPKTHIQEHNIMFNNQYNFIPLPETKLRHPLFGLNYKKAIKLPLAVAERLQASRTVTTIYTGKKKRKKDRRKSEGSEQESPIAPKLESVAESEDLMQSTATSKKKKKRKHKHSVTVDDLNAPRQKRVKHDPESAEAWESEKAIEENLFNF